MAATAKRTGRAAPRAVAPPPRDVLELVDGSLRIAVVADTHSQPHPRCLAHLRAEAPAAILHAGDIGSADVLEALGEIAPVFAVRGNIDPGYGTSAGVRRGTGSDGSGHATVPDARVLEIHDGPRHLLTMVLLHIAVYGPKLRSEAAALARAEEASLVVCGHSHVPFLGRDRGIAIFNPGSCGPKRFTLPILYGVIDVGRERVDIRHVECATGARWMP